MKTILKRVPGVRRAVRALSSGNPGAWVFTDPRVDWMYQPRMRSQLPAPYRVFAFYCWLQHVAGNRTSIVGGYSWFRLMRRLVEGRPESGWKLRLPTGAVVYVNLADPRFLQVVTELLATANAALLSRFLRAGDTFVDVGANHGSFSILASRIVGPRGRILAFEPQPRLARFVEQSLRANAAGDFRVMRVACGAEPGAADFFVPVENSGSSSLFESYAGRFPHEVISVPVVRFDEAVEWSGFPGRVMLKLDVEGSELSFLLGARAFLRARRPAILMEINPRSMRAAGVTVEDFRRVLREYGYQGFLRCSDGEVMPLDELKSSSFGNVVVLGSAG